MVKTASRYVLLAVIWFAPDQQVWAAGSPAFSDSRQVTVGDIELHYRESGQADAEPLVMIHGAFGSSQLWQDIEPLLSHQVRVIAPDTRGRGYTPRGIGPFTLVRMAEDILKLLDELGIEQAHFAGHSQGAAIVLTLIAHNEHRVKSAALSGMTHDRDLIRTTWKLRHRRLCLDAIGGRSGNADLDSYKQAWLSFGKPESEFQAHMEDHCLLWDDDESSPFTEDQLFRSQVPVLVMKAGRDPVLPAEGFDVLAALFVRATLVDLPEATHGLPRQMPREYADAWLEFIESL